MLNQERNIELNMGTAGYQAYKEQSVYTMTKGELLLVLYDEILKRLTRATIALDKKDYVTFDKSVVRAREIVNYLTETLNYQYSISRELRSMYDFFIYELARIDASRNADRIEELKPLVKDLRDAFAQADKMSQI